MHVTWCVTRNTHNGWAKNRGLHEIEINCIHVWISQNVHMFYGWSAFGMQKIFSKRNNKRIADVQNIDNHSKQWMKSELSFVRIYRKLLFNLMKLDTLFFFFWFAKMFKNISRLRDFTIMDEWLGMDEWFFFFSCRIDVKFMFFGRMKLPPFQIFLMFLTQF